MMLGVVVEAGGDVCYETRQRYKQDDKTTYRRRTRRILFGRRSCWRTTQVSYWLAGSVVNDDDHIAW